MQIVAVDVGASIYWMLVFPWVLTELVVRPAISVLVSLVPLLRKGKKKKKFRTNSIASPSPLLERATFRDVSAALNDREKGNFRDKNG